MKLAKQAVGYYTSVTGNAWSKFYDDLDEAMSGDLNAQTGDLWLIHALMNTIIANGLSINEFKTNKDAVKAAFDEEGRKLAGEFFTPVIWAEELHKYMDKYIPNWRDEYNVWESSCYSMDTEIFTKRGWVSYDELRDDDEVWGIQLETGETGWVSFNNRFVKDYNGYMYSFTGRSVVADSDVKNICEASCLVTVDHKMIVYVDGKVTEMSAEELYYLVWTNFEGKKIQIGHWGRDTDTAQSDCFSLLTLVPEDCFKTNYNDKVWDITMDKWHVFLTRRNSIEGIFSCNCGSGNLIRTANINPDHLFASSLQQDDINLIKATPELKDCTAFQLDFLADCDTMFYPLFTDSLPEKLQNVINNDEPLVFLINPPYKTGQASATAVGKYMNGEVPLFGNVNFSKPSYDLFYQFMFQIMNLVATHKLKNTYVAVFGPLTWFTGAGANILLQEYERTFEFIDGMCISAQEFSDTSTSILWGIGATVWKSRGEYMDEEHHPGINYHKDILLDKKFITIDGDIGCEGKVLYAPPREKLSTWVEPKDAQKGYVEAPLMTSHLTFKGAEVFEKTAKHSGKIVKDALGVLMTGNTLTRSADQSAILSMPSTIQYVSITEENFWRCVSSYAFRRTIDAGWAIAKKEISAPDTEVEGYDLWLKNALVSFLFEYKSMMSSLRNVDWGGWKDYNIYNKLFYLSEDEIRANCHDEVILKDLEEHPLQNQFMLEKIRECEPYWAPEIRQLYNWCKDYTLETFDKRRSVNYKGSLECADAGFQQLRAGLWDSEKLDDVMTKLLVQARDYLRRDLSKFGFVSEVQGADL